MIQIADEVILLADSSKFNIQAFTRVAGMESVGKVITDQAAQDEHVDALNELQITCIRV
jgi:DeoR/GlpR family transcriptional regulator of sugar metabolism